MRKALKEGVFWVNLVTVLALATFLIYEMTLPEWWLETFPMVIGSFTLLLFLWQIFSGFLRKTTRVAEEQGEEVSGSRGLLIIFSSIALFVFIYLIGFFAAGFLFLMVLPFVLGYKKSLIITTIAVIVILVFIIGDRMGILIFPKSLLF